MININLLPESMRKKEGLPLTQLLAVIVAVLILGGLFIAITKYKFDIIPNLENRRDSLTRTKTQLNVEVNRLKELTAEVNRMNGYVDAVKNLYKQRVVWAKILSDVKNIVNFDPAMNNYNPDMRYMWLTKFTGKGKAISMSCFATASNQIIAMQMPEQLLKEFLHFAPINLPEKDEESRLQEELRKAIAEHEAERRDRPELPLQGPQELAIRQRLEEIKSVQSGGIALLPFHELLVPGSLQMTNASWSTAPKPIIKDRVEIVEIFPERAWTFGVNMTLK